MIFSTLTERVLFYVLGLLILRLLTGLIKSFRAREWLFLIASYLFYLTRGTWFLTPERIREK